MREQDRTLECECSIYGFHKQVNLGERTWNDDDLPAMSYSLGIAIVVLVAEQNVSQERTHALQQPTSLFDDLVGAGEQGRRHVQAERFRGFEVDQSSYFMGACTGRSAGFSPLRMRSTYAAARGYSSN
jgi:hypothetical protein